MLDNSTYLKLGNGSIITMADLTAAIEEVLANYGSLVVSAATVSNSITFTSQDTDQTATILYGAYDGVPELRYTTDSGTNWNIIQYSTYDWDALKSYAATTPVLYRPTGAWYVSAAATTPSDIPGTSSKWRLLTEGSIEYVVRNHQQLKAALESGTASVVIRIVGDISNNVSASISADTTTIVIYSDESASVSAAAITFTCANNGTNIYWHSRGTLIGTGIAATTTITQAGGKLWINRLTVATGRALSLQTSSGNVYYQRVDGTVTAGSGVAQVQWEGQATSQLFVPLDLSSMSVEAQAYNPSNLIYVSGATNGYMTLGQLADNIGASTAWEFNGQGLLSNRPVAPEVQGYTYYAIDTGKVYVWRDGAWNDGTQIRGPEGSPGEPGEPGSPGEPGEQGDPGISPTITVQAQTGGTALTISDATGTRVTVIPDGRSPVFDSVETATLDPGMQATVTLTSTVDSSGLTHYAFSFGIPTGQQGSADAYDPPLYINNGTVSLVGYPYVPVQIPTDSPVDSVYTLVVRVGDVWDLTGFDPLAGLIIKVPYLDRTKFGEVRIRCPFDTIATLYTADNVELVDKPHAGETNNIRLVFWGQQGYLYVDGSDNDNWEIDDTPPPTPGGGDEPEPGPEPEIPVITQVSIEYGTTTYACLAWQQVEDLQAALRRNPGQEQINVTKAYQSYLVYPNFGYLTLYQVKDGTNYLWRLAKFTYGAQSSAGDTVTDLVLLGTTTGTDIESYVLINGLVEHYENGDGAYDITTTPGTAIMVTITDISGQALGE